MAHAKSVNERVLWCPPSSRRGVLEREGVWSGSRSGIRAGSGPHWRSLGGPGHGGHPHGAGAGAVGAPRWTGADDPDAREQLGPRAVRADAHPWHGESRERGGHRRPRLRAHGGPPLLQREQGR
ncbi:hypothetical protein F0U63_33400 [Cystobacter fuscus]|nr:hypothetical protein F0U63_33400 [Cystobacter fuscus]